VREFDEKNVIARRMAEKGFSIKRKDGPSAVENDRFLFRRRRNRYEIVDRPINATPVVWRLGVLFDWPIRRTKNVEIYLFSRVYFPKY